MPTPVPAMTAPPTVPVRGDRVNFATQSQNWTLWEKNYKFPESIALANNVFANANEAASSASNAANSVLQAAASAASAAQALAAAQAVSGAVKWVAGAYGPGVVVWSPSNGQNYRSRAAIANSTVDPMNDSPNWFPLLLQQSLPVVLVATAGTTVCSANVHYVVTVAGVNLQMPSSPNPGDLFGLTNASGVTTNTLDPNGKTLKGDGSVMTLDDLNASCVLKFTSVQGWIRQ